MIDNLITINEEYKALGLTKDLVIENFDTDVAGQIEQIENLINAGVDAMLVNPGDAVALNQILEEAVNMGILVFSIDQEIEAKGVINVGHNQYEWARISAAWLAETGRKAMSSRLKVSLVTLPMTCEWLPLPMSFRITSGKVLALSQVSGMKPPASRLCQTSWLPTPTLTVTGLGWYGYRCFEAIIAANPDPYTGVGEARGSSSSFGLKC